MRRRIDEKDKKIISLLSRDPDMPQEEIARKVGLSQPSVALRIKKLREAGFIDKLTGMNPKKMGVVMAKVDVETDDSNALLENFKECPYFLFGFVVSGKYNVSMIFFGDDISTLETIVNRHIRTLDFVKDVEFNVIIRSEGQIIAPIKVGEREDFPPCNPKVLYTCKECRDHGRGCLGCPITGDYLGEIF
ncbi:MAG: Lrp/AsnC family transcriptional regulator [Archaeoglobi archaeon]|nr:Lrp/AsnC family transcriptional regulator [Candidatus Mnemosynella bozhongmuii]